jgi:hypothetical protein
VTATNWRTTCRKRSSERSLPIAAAAPAIADASHALGRRNNGTSDGLSVRCGV